MSNPLLIGVTAIKVAPITKNRALVRFQNVGKKDIYIKKIPLTGVITTVSPTDYEIKLHADPGGSGKGEAFDTNSIAAFQAISVTPGSELAVYSTKYV